MQTIEFNSPEKLKTDSDSEGEFAFQWIDIVRRAELSRKDLPVFLQKVLHDRHLLDFKNSTHQPYYECTEEYEMLIFRVMDQRFGITNPRTRSTVFLVINNTIVTIHDEDDQTLFKLHKKWLAETYKRPTDLPELLHDLLDTIGNAYLELREPLNNQIQDWQRRLFDPNDPFNDWQVLLQAKSGLRWLKVNLELQREVLQDWREETKLIFNASHVIHFNDLDGHLGRIERLADAIRYDIDSLIEIYFATTGQNTNNVIQFLAVVSAIFLPLNLIASFFGMNFELLPFTRQPWGVSLVLLTMVLLTVGLLWWFKRKRCF